MKKLSKILMLLALTMALQTAAASAAETYKNKWVLSNDYYYYYNDAGKKVKNGIFEINGKKYYFDSKGRQRTGWRKIGKKTYFFMPANKAAGYMVTGKKADGVKLNKDGTANPTSARAKRKVPIMVETQLLVDKACKPAQKKSDKRWNCFVYLVNNFTDYNIPELGHTDSNWDLTYAEYLLSHGYGDCLAFGATFAFIANALGYKDVYSLNDTGHGWCSVEGKFYDPEWAKVIGLEKCYAVPPSLAGVDGRPKYTVYYYSVNIDN